jgi:C1A family cysteine protease
MSVGQNLNSIKNAISQDFPIVFGIDVYSSFESKQVSKTGVVPMPNVNTEQLLGGHAIMMISYDDTKKVFGCMNSWGTSWGNKGFFTLPYAYVLSNQLAFDFWTIHFF